MYGSKSAVSDIKRSRRGAGSGARRRRFAELALGVRFTVSPRETFGGFVLASAAALPELVARRVKREKTLTILWLMDWFAREGPGLYVFFFPFAGWSGWFLLGLLCYKMVIVLPANANA